MTEKEYNQMLEEIYQRFPSFQVVGGRAFKPGLGNMMALEEALGHPSRDFRAVHIAGTNGKGSVSHMIASALMSFPGQSGNLRVGLYTSPHLVDFRERIKVDGQMVEKEWVFNFLKDHKDLLQRIESRHGLRQLTYMKEMGMGNDRYVLIDLDNGEVRIQPKDAVKDVKPFEG